MIPAIKKRRSVREYKDEDIPEKKLKEILMATMFAPSAHHKQPWDLVVVKEKTMINKLSQATPWSTHAATAPVIIAVVGYEKESAEWVEDCSIVAEHIWLEVTEQGLSSCWIQIKGNDNAEKEVKELLNVPEDHRVLCLMPIGVPNQDIPEHTEDKFDKSKIKQEGY